MPEWDGWVREKKQHLALLEEVRRLRSEVREARFGMWVALAMGLIALFLSADAFFRNIS